MLNIRKPIRTKKRMAMVNRTAYRYFGFHLTPAIAKQVIDWDDDNYFVKELTIDGTLDTAPHDYFTMALVETLIPGTPDVEDRLLSGAGTRGVWHWPLNGSSRDYAQAFAAKWLAIEKKMKQETRSQHQWINKAAGQEFATVCKHCKACRTCANDMELCPLYRIKKGQKRAS